MAEQSNTLASENVAQVETEVKHELISSKKDRKSNNKRPTAEIYVPRHRREASAGKEKKSKSAKRSKKKVNIKPIETGPPKKAAAAAENVAPSTVSTNSSDNNSTPTLNEDETTTSIVDKTTTQAAELINQLPIDSNTQQSSNKNFDDIINKIDKFDISQDVCQPNASTTVEQESNQVTESSADNAESTQLITESSEEEWEKCFDETGECLDDNLMLELRNTIPTANKIQLKSAKHDYSDYDLNYEFGHVLEMYDFSEALQTSDLNAALNGTGCKNFVIRWVDDTHALIVLSDSQAALNVLSRFDDPLMKLRPFKEASTVSKSKATNLVESFQPFKSRPETSAVAARRMVATHLGVRPNISREQRQMEMKKVKDAREQKKKEAEQKRNIWDG